MFVCPACGQNLDAPKSMAGLLVECPTCEEVIRIPTGGQTRKMPKVAAPPPPAPAAETKAGVDEKSATLPIVLPPNLGVPQQRQRRIVIRRGSAPE